MHSSTGGQLDRASTVPTTQLTSDPAYEDQAAFSPDGKKLVFVSTRGSGYANLWTLDLATVLAVTVRFSEGEERAAKADLDARMAVQPVAAGAMGD